MSDTRCYKIQRDTFIKKSQHSEERNVLSACLVPRRGHDPPWFRPSHCRRRQKSADVKPSMKRNAATWRVSWCLAGPQTDWLKMFHHVLPKVLSAALTDPMPVVPRCSFSNDMSQGNNMASMLWMLGHGDGHHDWQIYNKCMLHVDNVDVAFGCICFVIQQAKKWAKIVLDDSPPKQNVC